MRMDFFGKITMSELRVSTTSICCSLLQFLADAVENSKCWSSFESGD